MNSQPVYVSGHRNPDSDSICAAISYSYLLNKIKRYNAIPVRLGEVNRETEFILRTFGLEIPTLLKSVKQKVEDLSYDKVTVFSKELTLKTAWSLLKEQNLKTAPILDDYGKLLGILSTSNIVEGYMDEWDSNVLKEAITPIENVIDTLEAKVITLNKMLTVVTGEVHIAAMNGIEASKRIHDGDVVLVGGDRNDTIEVLIASEEKPSLIILTGSLSVSDAIIDACKNAGISIISTPLNTFEASKRIIQAIPVEYVMQKGEIKTFTTDDTLDYVQEVMSQTRYRGYPVLDLSGRCVGSISRFALLKGLRKQCILVDHNERGQSIPGIEEADILEVVDHHRVADIQTVGPLLFRGEPMGCTCSIIYKLFRENDVEIPREIAGAMLGAILSDTLIFKSPTCTPDDKRIALKLAEIAGVDAETFGLDMFKAGTSLVGKTVEEIFNSDYKKFNFGPQSCGVGQVNTLDFEGFQPYKASMLQYMNEKVKADGLEFACLLLTDVINANSVIFVAGDEEKVEEAFNIKLDDHQQTLPGIISRKKQVVPAITAVM